MKKLTKKEIKNLKVITVNVYSAFFCKKKNPKRAACASLVEREEKGFEVALKR